MRVFKTIIIVILVIVGIVLIAALFIKKEMGAEREIVINKPKAEVYNYIKYLKNQNDYSKWGTMDPAMKKEFRGTDGTVGFVSAWDSDNSDVGKGEQEIKGIKDGERVDYEIRFIKPFESTATAYMTTDAVSEAQTKVKWGFNGKMNYPLNIMRLFMDMDKMIGDDFSTGLTKLKAKMESQ